MRKLLRDTKKPYEEKFDKKVCRGSKAKLNRVEGHDQSKN